MSAPHNPISEPQPTSEPQLQLAPSPAPSSVPSSEHPSWTIWDVIALTFITLFAIIACVFATAFFLHFRLSPGAPWIESLNRPEVIVGGQLLAYVFIVILMYKLLQAHSDHGVLDAIRWNWPSAWTSYLAAGIALEFCLLLIASRLPMPKNVPIDEFFRTARDAYILSLFGILFAPLFEELFFRGFLYPVVEVWLQAVFNSKRRIRFGRNLLLALALWGYALQRIPERSQLYLVITLAVATITFLLLRMIAQDSRILDRLVLPLACFAFWSFVAHTLHGPVLLKVTLVPMVLACALTGLLWFTPAPRSVAALAVAAAIGTTAFTFAAVHASQLKYSWGPVLIIFLVGVALTTVRALKKSVAATVLMHMAYNATIFVVTYIATDRFRHMERFNQ